MKALLPIFTLLLSLAACASTTTSAPTPVASADEEACAYEVAEVGGTPTDPNPNEVRRAKGSGSRRVVTVGCR